MADLKKVECDPKCGFMVQSHDEKELIEIVKQHAKKHHEKTVSDEDVKKMMKNA
jgi:predicted small metal-binding protein